MKDIIKKPCMLFEYIDNDTNKSFNFLLAQKKGAILKFHFCFRMAKNCIFRMWNYEKTKHRDMKVINSFANLVNNTKNIIELEVMINLTKQEEK